MYLDVRDQADALQGPSVGMSDVVSAELNDKSPWKRQVRDVTVRATRRTAGARNPRRVRGCRPRFIRAAVARASGSVDRVYRFGR